ncbi:dUTP nucleotidohydrolase [Bacillus phage SalinJah]|uniref:dUTP diphosphatase n=1 Tax=Bacillus phage SalinJah TaxID=1837830 RepID=A0A173GBL4_9CAUD|nr:dUTP nucleotidohydrolase [Bacillus phage SalinJah]ANH50595.1 dUTP nucleotidohydrolase [Bacillus phage SalinJah]
MKQELHDAELDVRIFLGKDAKLPTNAHGDDFCDDVYAAEGRLVPPATFKSVLVPTNITTDFDAKYGMKLNTRSGMGYKTPIILANSTGIIEATYRGTIGVLLRNTFQDTSLVDFAFTTDGKKIPVSEIPLVVLEQARKFYEEETVFVGYNKPSTVQDHLVELEDWKERESTGEFGAGNIARITNLLKNGEMLNMKDNDTWLSQKPPEPTAQQLAFHSLVPRGTIYIPKGEKVAQIHFQKIVRPKYEVVEDKEELTETKRGEGKYGSTGVK